MMDMTTISVTEDVKKRLLLVASELQVRWGRRVDLNDAIRYLIDERGGRPELLDEACRPAPDADRALDEILLSVFTDIIGIYR